MNIDMKKFKDNMASFEEVFETCIRTHGVPFSDLVQAITMAGGLSAAMASMVREKDQSVRAVMFAASDVLLTQLMQSHIEASNKVLRPGETKEAVQMARKLLERAEII
jgi:protein involved in polysaccharide export with SLBB domain